MLRFASPAVLYAGAVLALVPLLLHLIARRPADRSALPTARFLQPDPRTRIRMQRRPTDVPLMLLRMLFVLLVAAAFASPEWVPARRGTVELVLLDGGAGMAPVWGAALDEARARLNGGGLLVFDTTARVAAGRPAGEALLDSLAAAGPAAIEADYAAGFAALRGLVAALPAAESARVALITRPRWEAWGAGLAPIRAAAWPGRVALVALEGANGGGRPATASAEDAVAESAATRRAVLVAPAAEGVYAEAALGALGWEVTRAPAGELPAAGLYLVLGASPAGLGEPLLARVRAGAAAVVTGAADATLVDALPWRFAAAAGGAGGAATPERDTGAARGATSPAQGGAGQAQVPGGWTPDAAGAGDLVFDDGTRLVGAGTRHGGAAADGARVLAAWDDGRPAAAAARLGSGCVVYLATDPERGRVPLDPGFPAALDRLIGACGTAGPGAGGGAPAAGAGAGLPAGVTGPLDAGARAVLESPAAAPAVRLAALPGGGAGRPLFRWFVLAALVAAAVEALMSYRIRGEHARG